MATQSSQQSAAAVAQAQAEQAAAAAAEAARVAAAAAAAKATKKSNLQNQIETLNRQMKEKERLLAGMNYADDMVGYARIEAEHDSFKANLEVLQKQLNALG
jgi:uncharacterized FlaG/YvyC family protein